VDAGFYPFPSPSPASEPGQLEAGGRRNFEVSDLRKTLPDGTTAKLEVGDAVELYVEAFDKLSYVSFAAKPRGRFALPVITGFDRHTLLALPKDADGNLDVKRLPTRPAGYTGGAKRKIVLSESDVAAAILHRDEERQKRRDQLDAIAKDQVDVLKPKKKP
jgi:hypothetical protein